MIYDRSRDGLADGCCSAIAPCSHQQRDPTTMCMTCQAAALSAENDRLRAALERARNILGNMALEHTTGWRGIFARWPIHHEPLRSDARSVLPIIDAALEEATHG